MYIFISIFYISIFLSIFIAIFLSIFFSFYLYIYNYIYNSIYNSIFLTFNEYIQEITLNPMVYQLPSTPTLTIPATMAPLSIYQPSMLSPNASVGSSDGLTVNMSPPTGR